MSNIKIVINPKYNHLKETIKAIAYRGIPENAECIYRGRNSIHKLQVGSECLCIKSFKVPSNINKIVYTNIRKSKARRSFEAALRLNEMGLYSPEPFAYIEEKQGMILRHSYYICRHIEATDMRYVENCPDKAVKLKALAAEMLKVHRAGVRLLDFSPGNILLTRDEKGEIKFFHIDINRIAFNVTSKSQLYKMFGSMLVDLDDIRTLATEYARLANLPTEEVINAAIRVRQNFLKKQQRKKALKKLLRNA